MRIERNDLDKVNILVTKWLADAADIIGSEAVDEVSMHFQEEGTDGVKWKERLPDTPRNDRKILSDTNTLEDSVRYEVQQAGRQVVVGVDGDVVPYAEIHQAGGDIVITSKMRAFFWAKYLEKGNEMYKRLALAKGPLKVPARPYLVITQRMVDRIEKALLNTFKSLQK